MNFYLPNDGGLNESGGMAYGTACSAALRPARFIEAEAKLMLMAIGGELNGQ